MNCSPTDYEDMINLLNVAFRDSSFRFRVSGPDIVVLGSGYRILGTG